MPNGFVCKRRLTVVAALVVVCGLATNASAQNGIPQQVDALQNAVSTLEHQINVLQTQIANLLPSSGPLNLTVNCGSGQHVGSALAQAQGRAGAVTITITGVCVEHVQIERDDVTLQGNSPADGFQAPSPATFAVIHVDGARTTVRNLTITGGQLGLQLAAGSLSADSISVTGTSQSGIEISAIANISNSIFDFNQVNGVTVPQGGFALFGGSDISHNGFMGAAVNGGALELHNTTVSNNALEGIQSWTGGRVSLTGGTLQGNTFAALDLNSNSSAMIGGGTQVINNGSGVAINTGSVADLRGVTISGNTGGPGAVSVSGGSTLLFANGSAVVVQSNHTNGVWVQDTSVVQAWDPSLVQISQNTGWGILCAGSPAVAQIAPSGPFTLSGSSVFSNINGQISCPGNVVP